MKKLLVMSLLAMMVSGASFAQEKKTTTPAEKKEEKKEVKKEEPKLFEVGDKCGHFEFEDVNGNKVKLSDFKGKYILVDIWATWCPPCRKEIPHLQKLEERMHGKNIVFVSVSSDKNKDEWKKMVIDNKMTGIQLNHNGNWAFSHAVGAKTIPHFLLLDKKGKIVDLKMKLRPSSGDEIYNYLMSKKGM